MEGNTKLQRQTGGVADRRRNTMSSVMGQRETLETCYLSNHVHVTVCFSVVDSTKFQKINKTKKRKKALSVSEVSALLQNNGGVCDPRSTSISFRNDGPHYCE